MKTFAFVSTIFALAATAPAALAAPPQSLKGSDTLFGAITEAVNASGLQNDLVYVGGGSGQGEKALVAKTQGLAPMSRALTAQAIADAQAAGVTFEQNVVGLDGVGVFVKATEAVAQISLPTLKSIFGGVDGTGSAAACADPARITDWSKVPGSGKTGPIQIFRRNDDSGTTDTFKSLVGLKGFCADVVIRPTTADITQETSTNAAAIAYSGMSAEHRGANKSLAVAKDDASAFVAMSVATIRSFSYPLARRLYVNVATAGYTLTAAEQSLLANLLDRSFFDPILEANEFVTCDVNGCP